jgi:hypothetical protein
MMLANLDSGGGTLFLFNPLGFSLRRGTLIAQRFDFAHCLHRGVEVASFGKLFNRFSVSFMRSRIKFELRIMVAASKLY